MYEYFPSLPSNVAQQYDGLVGRLDRIAGIHLRPDLGTLAYARELSFDFVKARIRPRLRSTIEGVENHRVGGQSFATDAGSRRLCLRPDDCGAELKGGHARHY